MAAKEDILEQLVEEFLIHRGYFVRHNLKFFDGVAFFCQQGVEKALKALLIETTANFPKIHDLTKLAKLAMAPAEIISLCSIVNPAYTASRYPDSPIDYDEEDCEELLADCKVILEWIEEQLS